LTNPSNTRPTQRPAQLHEKEDFRLSGSSVDIVRAEASNSQRGFAVVQRLRIPLLILLWLGIGARAQAPASAAQPAHARTEDSVRISLGQSAVPLNGPWKFAAGDSPLDPLTSAA
jgi:hypothetical protein